MDWIFSTHALPTFVKNRIKEIHTANTEFRHVDSKENPADLPSRGISVNELINSKTWWHGPQWLSQQPNNWPPKYSELPSHLITIVPQPEIRTQMSIQVKSKDSPFSIDAQKFTRFPNLIRVTAYCVQFIRHISPSGIAERIFPNQLSSLELTKILWIRSIQQNNYSYVIDILKKKRGSNKSHDLIKKYRLFLDKNEILRCRGRFLNAPVSENEKFPILLPKESTNHVTRLIVLNIHTANLHVGTAHTLLVLRRQYWIPAGRRQIYSVLRQCNACRKEKSRPYKQPDKSDIPSIRFNIEKAPFTNVGLDTVGHFYVCAQKRWILIATCLVIRAIALEVLENMTTQHLYLALRRIIATHVPPQFFLSDNAPNLNCSKNTYTAHVWNHSSGNLQPSILHGKVPRTNVLSRLSNQRWTDLSPTI